jgi:mono/diheme cytochrome c family protein
MKRNRPARLMLIAAVSCLAFAFAYSTSVRGQAAQAPVGAGAAKIAPGAPSQDPRAVLDKYCSTCHNQRLKTAGLTLDVLDLAQVGDHSEAWEKVVRKIRTGAMPPAGRPRPDSATSAGVVTWLETALDNAALAHPNPGRPSLHRLNRTEYTNAIHDMLALDIDAASLLPADNAAYGFDNVADALSLSPALTERYLGAAAKIAQMALARVKESPLPETFFVPTDRDQGTRVSDDLPFGSRGGLSFRYYFPIEGEYTFVVRLKESGADGEIMGLTDEPHQLETRVDQAKVWDVTVGGRTAGPARGAGTPQPDPAAPADPNLQQYRKRVVPNTTFKTHVTAGTHLVEVYFVNKTTAYLEDLFDPSVRRDPYRALNGEPGVSSVSVTAPAGAAALDSPSRRKLFVCHPASAAEEPACAKKIIATFARRAYRRPVTDEDLETPLALYRDGTRRGGFESGVELAVRGVLVSPNFLFRFENQPATVAPNTPYRLTDLELASRLSFFLWSSIPDDELLDVATKNTLHTPAVMDRQLQRMLADPRSEALVSNFAGQWLHTRNVEGFRPSPELLFHFDDNLRQAFERETALFFDSIIRENRSVLDLLDADYTFLNERLAKHYGIPGVYGEYFRKVQLPPDSVRRGLLGQGSILTDTSRANRTSPVIRGKWILENVFGTPPPPPPPNVPDLKDERDPSKVLPMREQMAAHRANPVCAACHAQMDQLGFALENFDAIGEWRDTDVSGVPIDPSAKLPDGTEFRGPTGLRKVLMNHSDEFLTTLTEKMLTYALGRGLDSTDAPAIRQIKREAAPSNYRFASLIKGIVTSTPFQMRMAQAETN